MPNELQTVRAALLGDSEAAAQIHRKHHTCLLGVLMNRGALMQLTRSEVEECVGDLWSDCFGGTDTKPALLTRFGGDGPLRAWLITVGLHRLIDLARRKRFRHDISADEETSSANPMDKIPAADGLPADADVVSLLQTSLKKAFARCNREQLLLLCLVYLHGIKQKELADIYGCNESTISRWLDSTIKQIHADTLHEVNALDPATGLDWREIVQLCDTIDEELSA
jgi:RNA polymerase sigma factor (sigma-70 family)